MGFIVAIDGATGTGKSYTSQILAKKLGFGYVDSGAYYRTITYMISNKNLKPNDINKILSIANNIDLVFNDSEVFYKNDEISLKIKSLEVINKVSSVSKIKQLREVITQKIRLLVKDSDYVIEGQDIGTVIFPEANFKFFLTCDIKARIFRRQQEFMEIGLNLSEGKILKELLKRDELDTSRQYSPLTQAKDALVLDTTNLILEEQVEILYRKIKNIEDSESDRFFNSAHKRDFIN